MKTLAVLLAVALLWGTAHAADEPRADTRVRTKGWSWELDPAHQPYPDYLADPRRPRMNIGLGAANTSIPETSSGRVFLDAGTRYTLFRVETDPEGVNEFALDIQGGLFMQFDAGRSLDNIGWDGVYGVFVVQDWSNKVSWRMGYRHLSAHLGDEYIQETGRSRVGYTREDIALGVAYHVDRYVTAYAEPNWAWGMGNEDRQPRWAVEGGAQYQGPHTLWNNSTALYGGVHVKSFQENDWNPDVSGQFGFLVKRGAGATSLRMGIEGYVGRAILGEYALDHHEASVSANFTFDFY